jgi:hypothetical protein
MRHNRTCNQAGARAGSITIPDARGQRTECLATAGAASGKAGEMDFNRNHYLMAGLVLLCLGVQLRLVESFVLNEKASNVIAARSQSKPAQFLAAAGPTPRKEIHPPGWLGWALMSIGSVLILQSLAMPKPEGGG